MIGAPRWETGGAFLMTKKTKNRLEDIDLFLINSYVVDGLEPLLEIIQAADQKRPPSQEVVKQIADAAVVFLKAGRREDQLIAFGKKLGIFERGKRGAPTKSSSGDVGRALGIVQAMLKAEADMIADGVAMREASKRAVEYAMAEFHLSKRKAQGLRTKFRTEVERLTQELAPKLQKQAEKAISEHQRFQAIAKSRRK